MPLFTSRLARISIAMLCACAASAIVAQESGESASKTRWSAEVGVGGEYDTNVSVDEVDLSSGQSDYAAILDLELGVKHSFNDRTEASLNYDVSSSTYQEFSAVDRLTHILGADINTDLGSSNASLSAYYIDSQLDGNDFLKYTRISPSLSGFLSQRWFARGAYVYSEREIDNRSQRDAETHTGELDFYYFHRGLRSYLNLGYRYREEDAVADELDFNAHSLKLRYIRRFDAWERKIKVEAALRYEVRDYNSDEPTIEEPRNDDRLRVKFDLELPLTQRLNWQWYLSYGDYVSNLPRADFTQTIFGTRLQYSW
ncbi:surface lipoprotein assembly modifier [Congregibacter sp.]|uniref:surface lipoprotein assembly modifier n=1 Tax=Congregibacter sp. TaxID=2744308 RepID=UPI003F6C4A83